jgi:hypothetical protein
MVRVSVTDEIVPDEEVLLERLSAFESIDWYWYW